MRMDELKGYRTNLFYKIASQSSDIENFYHRLKNQGYRDQILGRGIFGLVFHRPNTPDAVYKAFLRGDRGYMKYLKFALENQHNPHVPKIIGKPLPFALEDGTQVVLVKLERLDELDPNDTPNYNQFLQLTSILNSLSFLKNPFYDSDSKKKEEELLQQRKQQYPTLYDIAQQIVKLSHKSRMQDVDLHSGNVMMRDNTLVVTDPYAFTPSPTSSIRRASR